MTDYKHGDPVQVKIPTQNSGLQWADGKYVFPINDGEQHSVRVGNYNYKVDDAQIRTPFKEGDTVQVLVSAYGAWYPARYIAPASGFRHMVEVLHPAIGASWISDANIKPLEEGQKVTSQIERRRQALRALGDAVYLHATTDQGYIGTITAWTNRAIALGAGSAEISTAFIDGMPLKNALLDDPKRDLIDSIVDTDPDEL